MTRSRQCAGASAKMHFTYANDSKLFQRSLYYAYFRFCRIYLKSQCPDVGSTTLGAIVPTKAIVLSNGNTLLGWTVTSPTGGNTAMMQIFDAAGNADGPAFAAPTEFGNARFFLDAIAAPDGGFFAQISMSGEAVQYVRYDGAGGVVGHTRCR